MESALRNLDIQRLNSYKIILGSGSARRKELLESTGLNITVIVKDHFEDYARNQTGPEIAVSLSKLKADDYLPIKDDKTIVITADTIVLYDGVVFGKPANREEAISMIKCLSGRKHEVITGITLISDKKERSFFETTFVTFDNLSDSLISYYVDNFKPYDKAGAYGIQEWIGTVACSKVEGSYLNVVGLPVQRLLRELMDFTS